MLLVLVGASFAPAQVSGLVRTPEWIPVDFGYESNITEERNYIITNQKEFEEYLQLSTGRRRSPYRFDVPWDKVVLVALHMGPCASTGFQVYVQGIDWGFGGNMTIRYARKHPTFGEQNAAVRTSPFMLVMVQRPSGNFNFMKTLTVTPLETYYDTMPVYGFGCVFPQSNRNSCGNCSCCNNGNGGWRIIATEVFFPDLGSFSTSQSALPAIQWRTYKDGNTSRIKDNWTKIINNEAEFQTYWNKAFGNPPQTAPRDIEWGKEMLVAIHVGEFNNGGSSVYVESVGRPTPNDARVSYVVSSPNGKLPGAAVMTQPWTIIRMNRPGANISFSRRDSHYTVNTGGGGNCRCGGRCGCKCCRG